MGSHIRYISIVMFLVIHVLAVVDAGKIRGMYVFGDSSADVGNNNYLNESDIQANFPPYGVDYPGFVPTGRFSNGYNFVDFLAKKMGYMESPPAVLSISEEKYDNFGLNFASGGAGIFPARGLGVPLGLGKQIAKFRQAMERLVKAKGKKFAMNKLSRSLLVFSIGTNDIFHFHPASRRSTVEQGAQLVSNLAGRYKESLLKVYNLGGRRFLVIGLIGLGCMPESRLAAEDGSCTAVLNELARRFNAATKEILRELSSENCGFNYAFMNTYALFDAILANPRRYGFKEIKSACCGGGRLRAERKCYLSKFCMDRKGHLFWDRSHPTQGMYHLIANTSYNGQPGLVDPINVQQLIT